MPGEVFREFVKYLYQQNLLVKNQMPVGRHIVNLKRITCPVLNLMATKDDLVPPAQSEPFNDLVGSTDRKTIKLPAGHIGLAMGSQGPAGTLAAGLPVAGRAIGTGLRRCATASPSPSGRGSG